MTNTPTIRCGHCGDPVESVDAWQEEHECDEKSDDPLDGGVTAA